MFYFIVDNKDLAADYSETMGAFSKYVHIGMYVEILGGGGIGLGGSGEI